MVTVVTLMKTVIWHDQGSETVVLLLHVIFGLSISYIFCCISVCHPVILLYRISVMLPD